jgi:hypothetical protein
MEEIWKDITDYLGYYQVSNLGNVRSLERTVTYELKTKSGTVVNKVYKAKNLKTYIGTHGYYSVGFHVNKINVTVNIHRLVAEAFIPNPDNKPEVNHKDGVKINNNVFNLEWVTQSENMKHSYNTGLQQPTWTGKFGIEHPESKSVIQLNKVGNILNKFGSGREAERKTGVNHKNISSCCRGIRMSAGGYCWKFDNIL